MPLFERFISCTSNFLNVLNCRRELYMAAVSFTASRSSPRTVPIPSRAADILHNYSGGPRKYRQALKSWLEENQNEIWKTEKTCSQCCVKKIQSGTLLATKGSERISIIQYTFFKHPEVKRELQVQHRFANCPSASQF